MSPSLTRLFYHLPHRLQRPIERLWYESLSFLDRDADMVFMNYGWASLDATAPLVPPEDEANRYCVQLYHRVAGAVDLRGKDVLEIGSGRGGGASYVMRHLGPRSLTAVDFAARAVAFCQAHYTVPGLIFVRGKAEALKFDAESFDAVINIESSHCYASMERFLRGVSCVLRPGGHFLYADHRLRDHIGALRRQLHSAGLALLEQEDLTANILKALEMDNGRKQALIRAKVPPALRPFFSEFAAMEGTPSIYGELRGGERAYLRFVLRKE